MSPDLDVREVPDLPPADSNAQNVELLSVGPRTFLTYEVNRFTGGPRQGHALVEFLSCSQFMGGGPNDEAFHNHPLYRSRLEHYTLHVVTGSPWAAERIRIGHKEGIVSPRALSATLHYIFALKEGAFECLAEGHTLVGIFTSRREALRHALELCEGA